MFFMKKKPIVFIQFFVPCLGKSITQWICVLCAKIWRSTEPQRPLSLTTNRRSLWRKIHRDLFVILGKGAVKTEIFAKKSFDRFMMRKLWWKNCEKSMDRLGRAQVLCDLGTLENMFVFPMRCQHVISLRFFCSS